MSAEPRCTRYRTDRLPSTVLRKGPAGPAVERLLGVYLPPGYEDEPRRRYPAVYFLHGYGMDGRHLTIGSRSALRRSLPFPVRLLAAGILRRLLFFETLDRLIRAGDLAPFILVQPDGSLPIRHLHGARLPDRAAALKGSLYADSPHTGRYASHVFEEVVGHVDRCYRTRPERSARSLAGGSMGGYGALLGGILHPDRFGAVAALSPAVSLLDLLEVELVVPYLKLLLGEKRARERGRLDLDDILDTADRVFSADRPLRQERTDPVARDNWARAGLEGLAARVPGALKGVRVLLNCEESDEFGFAAGTRRLHEVLLRLGVEHAFEIYSDPLAARYSPHTFGIAWHLLPALRFCLAGAADGDRPGGPA